MAKQTKYLLREPGRGGVARPLVWILLWFLFFEHVEAPVWVIASVFTLVGITSLAYVIETFSRTSVNLELEEDGSVRWEKS